MIAIRCAQRARLWQRRRWQLKRCLYLVGKRKATCLPGIEIIECSQPVDLAYSGFYNPSTRKYNIPIFYYSADIALNCECTTLPSKMEELDEICQAICHSFSLW